MQDIPWYPWDTARQYYNRDPIRCQLDFNLSYRLSKCLQESDMDAVSSNYSYLILLWGSGAWFRQLYNFTLLNKTWIKKFPHQLQSLNVLHKVVLNEL